MTPQTMYVPEQVPIQGERPHTDDALRLGRVPIKLDLRVPMFASDDPLEEWTSVDTVLYQASLSAPDLDLHIRLGRWWATGHYRGVAFSTAPVGSIRALLAVIAASAAQIDRTVGGIRVKKHQRIDATGGAA